MFRADQIQSYTMLATNEVRMLFESNLAENQLAFCEHVSEVVDSLSSVSSTTTSTTTIVDQILLLRFRVKQNKIVFSIISWENKGKIGNIDSKRR